MTVSLRSVSRKTGSAKIVRETIVRRLSNRTRGLGFWAAVDALKHMDAIERMSIIVEAGLKAIPVRYKDE